jgi:hypothetical protein
VPDTELAVFPHIIDWQSKERSWPLGNPLNFWLITSTLVVASGMK